MKEDHALGTYFNALYRIVLRVSSSLALDDVLAFLTEETAKAIEANASSVRLLDESGEHLEMRAVYGLSQNYLNKGPVELARSPVDRAILAGQPSQLTDVTKGANFQYPDAAAQEGIVSVASVPLLAHGRPVGVMRVYTHYTRIFTDAEIRFLVAVGDIAALCIENAQLYDRMRQNYEDTMNTLWGTSRL